MPLFYITKMYLKIIFWNQLSPLPGANVLKTILFLYSSGRRRLLKCLLEMHGVLSESDPRYLLNDLYITDYCVWIQNARYLSMASYIHIILI